MHGEADVTRDETPDEAPGGVPDGGAPRDDASDGEPSGDGAPDTRQARNPLHGVTLERMLTELSAALGWAAMGRRVPIRCFTHDPSVVSSLKFLRRTPWARQQVEALYLQHASGARPRGAPQGRGPRGAPPRGQAGGPPRGRGGRR
jgi:hypothetical protein